MKIAQFKTKDKRFEVSWLLFTPPTFKLIHHGGETQDDHRGTVFADCSGVLPEKSGLVVEARILVDGDTDALAGIGFTACSPKDQFDLCKGLKGSLAHAIADLQDNNGPVDTTELWAGLFADGLIGPVLKGDYGGVWRFSPLAKELGRRFSTVTRHLEVPKAE